MTGVAGMFQSGGTGAVISPLNANVNANGTTVTASMTLNSDGTISYVNTGGATTGPANWFSPTTTAIGSSYWINFSITSGVFSATPGTAGTWISMSGAPLFRNTSAAGSTRVGQASFSIASDAAGVNVVGTGTVNCSCN